MEDQNVIDLELRLSSEPRPNIDLKLRLGSEAKGKDLDRSQNELGRDQSLSALPRRIIDLKLRLGCGSQEVVLPQPPRASMVRITETRPWKVYQRRKKAKLSS